MPLNDAEAINYVLRMFDLVDEMTSQRVSVAEHSGRQTAYSMQLSDEAKATLTVAAIHAQLNSELLQYLD